MRHLRAHQNSAKYLFTLLLILTCLLSSFGLPIKKAGQPASLPTAVDSVNARHEKEDKTLLTTSEDEADSADISREERQLYERIVADVQQRMTTNNVPGGAIAIVRHGRLRFATGIGLKRHDATDPVTSNSVFRIGSLTKMLTAITAMSLVDEGRLNLHCPITAYLPWFEVQPPFDVQPINMHHLLTHQSGIPSGGGPTICPTGPNAIENHFREASPMLLFSTPGRYYNYSNQGFALAGLIAEKIDGRPYDDMVGARVFEPAGMMTATFNPEVAQSLDHAVGHTVTAGQVTQTFEPTSYDCGYMHPAGFAFASVRDFARLAEVLLRRGQDVISRRSNRTMQSSQVWTRLNRDQYYGYALYQSRYKGIDTVWHNGSIPGFQTFFLLVPGRKDAIVVFINSNTGSAFGFGRNALSILYGIESVPVEDYRTPPSTWTVYEGTYHDPHQWGEIRLELRDDRLWAEFVDLGWSGTFTQTADDYFSINPQGLGPRNVVFHREAGGQAEAMVFQQGTVAERVH